MRTSVLLHEIQQLRYDFGEEAAERKRELLTGLAERALPGADEVFDLHEELCFLRAYPPNPEVRDLVGRMLAHFEQRRDLQRYARTLVDSGIAGTTIHFRFFWLTAIWLIRQGWGGDLTVDWKAFENKDKLADLLHLLLPFAETPGLDSFALTPEEWIGRLKAPDESDAAFLIRRFESLRVPTPMREKLYEDLDIPMTLAPGPTTPARGRDEWSGATIV